MSGRAGAGVRRHVRPVAGLAVVATAIVGLHALGDGLLAPPPIGRGDDLRAWVAARDPATIGFALFRLGALALAYHLAITSALAAVGAVLDRAALVSVADAWTLPPFRGAVQRVVGVGLSATAALSGPVPMAAAGPPSGEVATATLRVADPEIRVLGPDGPGGDGATLRLAPAPRATGEVTLRLVDPAPRPADPEPHLEPVPRAPDVPDGPAAAGMPEPSTSNRHVVQVGDHLWALAERELAAALGRAPSEAEVGAHWRRVVAANPQLVDPDLLHPGDEVQLPAP